MAKKMHEIPIDDALFGKGNIRTIPARDAFRPMAAGNCPLAKS